MYQPLDQLFSDVDTYLRNNTVCTEATDIFNDFLRLKWEYESLRNYELKLVFPSILKMFGTKNPDSNQISIADLQTLTKRKEVLICSMASEIEQEAERLSLPVHHPLFRLCSGIEQLLPPIRQEWNGMMDKWRQTCACFRSFETGNQ
ncbi:MAG: hypothetical protein QM743_03795 [Chitinophagaceae bacterium]